MTNEATVRAEIAKRANPTKRNKLAIVGGALGVIVLAVGGFFGVNAANAYRADIEASQTAAENALALVDQRADEAAAYADQAAESAAAAQTAATALAATEAAQAAQQAADDAAASARAAQPGSSGSVKCPAGSSANSSDGVNDTSCLADVCFHIAVPDPAHPECDVAFRP